MSSPTSLVEVAMRLLYFLEDQAEAYFMANSGISLDEAARQAYDRWCLSPLTGGEIRGITEDGSIEEGLFVPEEGSTVLDDDLMAYVPAALTELGWGFTSEVEPPFSGYGDRAPSWEAYLEPPVCHALADRLRSKDDERLGALEVKRFLPDIPDAPMDGSNPSLN